MAVGPLVPKNGAVAFAGYTADYASFSIAAGQAVDNISAYGTATVAYSVGSGTPDIGFDIGAFALSHATGTQPGICGTGTLFQATGATATLTLDTGVSWAWAAAVAQTWRIGHARMRGYVPIALSARTGRAEITETYATT